MDVYNISKFNNKIKEIVIKYTLSDIYRINDEDVKREGSLYMRLLLELFDINKGINCGETPNPQDTYDKLDKFEKSIQRVLHLIKCKNNLVLFSHDTFIIYLMRNLLDTNNLSPSVDVQKFWWPQVMSDFTIELVKQDDNNLYFRIFYNGLELNKTKYKDNTSYTSNGIPYDNFIKLLKLRISPNPLYNDNLC